MINQKSVATCLAVFVFAICADHVKAADDITVTSPGGNVQFKLLLNESRPRFSVMLKDAAVVEPSPLIFTLDKTDITDGVTIGNAEHYTHNETFPCRLIHSTATDHCNGITLPMHHSASGTDYTLEVRAYDTGVAFRTIVAGKEDQQRVPDERTTFIVPDGSTVWHHSLTGHYEGDYTRSAVGEIAANEWCAPPMTFKLPGDAGYGSITEADLKDYPGMVLSVRRQARLCRRPGRSRADLASVPASLYERRHRPRADAGEDCRHDHHALRVILVAPDLNGLVNSDVIQACCPPPDPKLFPDGANTDWCKPGRRGLAISRWRRKLNRRHPPIQQACQSARL